MAKVKLTAGRIAGFQCDEGKSQAFLWCAEVPGLGVRATAASTAKRYIFQAKVKGQSMRVTIGKVSAWSIDEAQVEARRLQRLIDNGNDPRQVKADIEAAQDAEAAALVQKQVSESVTVAEAWKVYIADRTASIVDGKPEWGERHKAHHEYFVQAGGVKRTRGRRPNERKTTRPGMLVPLMSLRLADLDAKAVGAWMEKEVKQAPTSAAKAFRFLRAFLTWCAKQDKYRVAVHPDACQADDVKKMVPTPKVKKNDSLRKAQIQPWFEAVQKVGNPVIAAYLQCLLLTGARRNELAALRWQDVDFQWKSLTIRDKVEGERTIPMTPFVEHLIATLPRRNGFVFSSPTAKSGRLEEPRNPHNKALAAAALPALSLHGLRRSFGTLSEWVEVPAGIVAQIMGHKPSAIAEKHYIQRELDLLHLWHVKIEAWILEQAGIKFVPVQAGLQLVKS
ncbi:tyrosine-type recombinase/integrase [Sulfuricella sp.]|uniref:tyrosine-type recombinase/integrase n=1 Tax=Sulfuricella sp. TaxID=2099377 RepID=UPI002B928A94|nr:tyrosine-type recombinase/integrase [Sulfuricella sp.]HUX64782.1 tyrosine-type recombinase/integrase [Sulfuricella sp.]